MGIDHKKPEISSNFLKSVSSIHQARKLKKENETLVTPPNYFRRGLDKETKEREGGEKRDLYCPIPVGVAGSHNVFVCTYLQNVKLKLQIVNPSFDYRVVLKLCVCSTENSDCMLHH